MPIFSFIWYIPPKLFGKKPTTEDSYTNKQFQLFMHQTSVCLKLGVKKQEIYCTKLNFNYDTKQLRKHQASNFFIKLSLSLKTSLLTKAFLEAYASAYKIAI